MKFRKKPVVIDAIQWDGTLSGLRAIEAALPTIDTRAVTSHPPSNTVTRWRIGTLEGGHDVSPGDWIITGVKGEHYPCKPDIFAATYDPAEPPNWTPPDVLISKLANLRCMATERHVPEVDLATIDLAIDHLRYFSVTPSHRLSEARMDGIYNAWHVERLDSRVASFKAWPDETTLPRHDRSSRRQAMSDAAFESWWEAHGQYGRAGGGEYEKTFAYNAWVSQSERIRVLREALEKLTACKAVEIRLRQLHEMGHGTDYDQHRQQFADAWVKARAALEATK